MAHSMLNGSAAAPLPNREIRRPSPVKAKLTAREMAREKRPSVGVAFKRAMDICGVDVKQAAVLLGFVDEETGEVLHAQVSRWIAGTENVQLDRVYNTKLHGPFAIEMARDDDQCVIETTVKYRAVTQQEARTR